MPPPSVLPPGATTPSLVLTPVYFAVEFVIENNAREFWSARAGVSLSLWHAVLLNSLFKALIPTDISSTQPSREGRHLRGGVECPLAGGTEQLEEVL